MDGQKTDGRTDGQTNRRTDRQADVWSVISSTALRAGQPSSADASWEQAQAQRGMHSVPSVRQRSFQGEGPPTWSFLAAPEQLHTRHSGASARREQTGHALGQA